MFSVDTEAEVDLHHSQINVTLANRIPVSGVQV
jgi:hypothetical protein